MRLGAQGTFDSFNLVVAGVKGAPEQGLGLIYETLTTPALDEPSAPTGSWPRLLAIRTISPPSPSACARRRAGTTASRSPPTTSSSRSRPSRPTARTYAFYYANVDKAEKLGEREVTFTFDEKGNRELPQIVGQLIVLPKHWWEGTAPDGRKRDVTQTTLEPPLGSGPYRLKSFEAGRTAIYERVKDYWGADLNVNVGTEQFRRDPLRVLSRRDGAARSLQGRPHRLPDREQRPQLGDGLRLPGRAQEGRVILEEFPMRATGVMQAFVFNLRRDKFKDERVRRAFNLAFDFEEINSTLFFGLYERITSFFHGLDLASSGLPQGQELAILESVRDKVPPAVFTTPYKNPVGGTPEAIAQQSARGRPPPARGRLGGEGGASASTPRASFSRSSFSPTARTTSATSCPTSRPSSGSASPSRCASWTRSST